MMITLRKFLTGNARRLKKDEKGATAIEYGLIAALISVAIIAGASTLGGTLKDTFKDIATCMDSTSGNDTCAATGLGGTTTP